MSISLSVRLIYDPEFKALFFPQAPRSTPHTLAFLSYFPRRYNPLSLSQLAGLCCPLVLRNLLIKSADWKTPGNNV